MRLSDPSSALLAARRAAGLPAELSEDELQAAQLILSGRWPDGTPLNRETFEARRDAQRAAEGLPPIVTPPTSPQPPTAPPLSRADGLGLLVACSPGIALVLALVVTGSMHLVAAL